jgi:hypothetical protein
MSIQNPITVVLANRPRLFRELLQHALKTQSTMYHVVEAVDAPPSPQLLSSADWLIVDEEAAKEATKWTAEKPQLGIIALDGRGSSARIVAAGSGGVTLSSVPTLAELLSVLSQPVRELAG